MHRQNLQRQRQRQTDRQTETETETETGKDRGRGRGRGRGRDRQRQTETETETETEAETEAEPPSNASSALTLFILVEYNTTVLCYTSYYSSLYEYGTSMRTRTRCGSKNNIRLLHADLHQVAFSNLIYINLYS